MDIMKKKKKEMMEAFLKLTPEQRLSEMIENLNQTLERVAYQHKISIPEAYEMLLKNKEKLKNAKFARK